MGKGWQRTKKQFSELGSGCNKKLFIHHKKKRKKATNNNSKNEKKSEEGNTRGKETTTGARLGAIRVPGFRVHLRPDGRTACGGWMSLDVKCAVVHPCESTDTPLQTK